MEYKGKLIKKKTESYKYSIINSYSKNKFRSRIHLRNLGDKIYKTE